MLSERCLQEEDIENPLAALSEDSHNSQMSSAAAGLDHSDSSDIEQEQDFVSSVVSQKPGPRVHWGDLPKRTDEDEKEERVTMEKKRQQRRKDEIEYDLSQDKGKKDTRAGETEIRTDGENQLHTGKTDKVLTEKPSVEEATAKLNLCSLSQAVVHNPSLPVDSTATQATHTTPHTTSSKDLNPCTESRPRFDLSDPTSTSTAGQNNHHMVLQNQSDLNITQMGMSRKGAAGLQALLKNHNPTLRPDSIRLNLLENFKRTLKEWSTDETLNFLYGADHSLGAPFADVKEKREVEEELDEDDLEDEVTIDNNGGVNNGRPSAAAPDYKTLQKDTQQMELRIREFYKGTWILPEEMKEPNGDEVSGAEEELRRREEGCELRDLL